MYACVCVSYGERGGMPSRSGTDDVKKFLCVCLCVCVPYYKIPRCPKLADLLLVMIGGTSVIVAMS
jgi:hypothetical protein